MAVVERFRQFLADSEIEIVPFDAVQVRAAAVAFNLYGKGINPKGRLNLSDCGPTPWQRP
jgi:ribonuclease VapC